MTAFGKESFTVKKIPAKKLVVIWPEAQRGYYEKHSQNIADNFDSDVFGFVSAIGPDESGFYHVFDGRHRVSAVRMKFGDDEMVPCHVFSDEHTAKNAAFMFRRINGNIKNISPLDNFKIAVTEGDETAVVVNSIVTRAGYRIGPGKSPGNISAISSCLRVYKRFGGYALINSLNIIKKTWGDDANATDGHIITGVSEFMTAHKDKIDKKRLVDRLSDQYTPGRLLGAAKNSRDMFGGTISSCICKILQTMYNTGLRANRLKDVRKKAA